MRGSMLWIAMASWAGGCVAIEESERSFLSNREQLDEVARQSGYEVPAEVLELTSAEVSLDSLTFQYRGLLHPGDSAWVVRFSVKSTEQDPDAVADVYALLPVIQEGREGFHAIDEGEKALDGLSVRYVRYGFESPVRDVQGRPFPGRGIIATVSGALGGEPVVFHLKLDNHGDRPDVTFEDLEPLLEPIRGAIEP